MKTQTSKNTTAIILYWAHNSIFGFSMKYKRRKYRQRVLYIINMMFTTSRTERNVYPQIVHMRLNRMSISVHYIIKYLPSQLTANVSLVGSMFFVPVLRREIYRKTTWVPARFDRRLAFRRYVSLKGQTHTCSQFNALINRLVTLD